MPGQNARRRLLGVADGPVELAMSSTQSAAVIALALALVPGCTHGSRLAAQPPSAPVADMSPATADAQSRQRAAEWLMEEATDSGDVRAIRRALAAGA